MIYQYAVKITNIIGEYNFDSLIKGISNERKQKIKRYLQPRDKWISLIAEILLRYVLHRHYGLKGNEILFFYNSKGKPFLYNHPEIYFSLSHSGDWVLCGIADVPIGVDVEHITKIDLSLAERVFHEKEYAHILQQPYWDRINTFFQIWTLKESYIKNVGSGFSLPLNSFYLNIDTKKIIVSDKTGINLDYSFAVRKLDLHYCSAICVNRREEVNNPILYLSLRELFEWHMMLSCEGQFIE